MDSQEYLAQKINLQNKILEFLDKDENLEENFQNLNILLDNQNIKADKNEFRLFLHLIDNISNNHHRYDNFFDKIEKILLSFKDVFKTHLSNDEIVIIFAKNKRILLFLIENEIISMNQFILHYLNFNEKITYYGYFINEIKQFISVESESQIDSDFIKNRHIGENDQLLCQIIRKDSIKEFTDYVDKNDLHLNSTIKPSKFETNLFLLDKKPTLIEYSAFFGSIQIFKYLIEKKIGLTSSLWIYSIHGANVEIISILEENKIEPEDKTYESCLFEAIKCHHNEIADYIKSKFLKDKYNYFKAIDYYNFMYFPEDFQNNQNVLYYFCKFDYFCFVKQLIKFKNIEFDFRIGDKINNESCISTPFLIAIKNNNSSIAELILSKCPKIDVNAQMIRCDWSKYEKSENALMLSILNNNQKMIQLLLENKNIDINATVSYKEYLKNSEIRVNEFCPLYESVTQKNIEVVKLLLSHENIDVNKKQKFRIYDNEKPDQFIFYDETFVLQKAVEIGNYEIVKMLMDNPEIDVNAISSSIKKGYNIKRSPLYMAIATNINKIIKLILSNPNIDVNQQLIRRNDENIVKDSPLCLALQNSNIEIVKLLLENQNIDVNMQTIKKSKEENIKNSPLCIAIAKNNLEVIEILLANPKIDVNQISFFDEKKYSALTLSILSFKPKFVSILLSHKDIDVNLKIYGYNNKINYEENALKYAVSLEMIKNVELLLNHPDIDVNLMCINESPNEYYIEKHILFYAIENENEDILQLLLNHPKIDPNLKILVKTKKYMVKNTALLHMALSKSNINIIRCILDNPRIDVNISSFSRKIKEGMVTEKVLPTIYYVIKFKRLDALQILLSKSNFDVNLKLTKTVLLLDDFFIEERTSLQLAVFSNNLDFFQLLFDRLKMSQALTDNLNELMKMTNNKKIKSIIYNYINKHS